ncbi:NitT/TauT family transport system substrate-binding protein [Pseudochelatococcus lubricantis]|uniref:NitT/TauT family transport system substrate-binding protein n=1 Tax=Pseudochelatococcus lubricantis TaxID=1538102 RepID=A0ABX0V3B7_9HYPH|nr:ABC transporter substrate-binding protein [Pseudochelatococcus lubricantis]NIJ59648.1 NitT/TauT family transport system substrate-binding protein [Pseudochelatococcus lubricantis]
MSASSSKSPLLSRRAVLGATALAAGAPFVGGLLPVPSFAQSSEPIRLGWTGTGICLISIPVARDKGFFTKHGANVEFVNFGSNFASGIEAVSSGKLDVFVNFILQYIKPLEQGVNVQFTGSVHGGCIRLLARSGSEETDYASLKGRAIGVRSIDSPGKQFLSVQLYKAGIDPQTEVEWKVYPVDLLGEAIKKGEIQAAIDADPGIYLVLKNSNGTLKEIGGLHTGQYANLACCAIGISKEFVEARRGDAAAVTRALLEAAQWTHENPDEAADLFTNYSPVDRNTLAEIIRSHNHSVNLPVGDTFRAQLETYATELKTVGIVRRRTDPQAFVRRITADVLS